MSKRLINLIKICTINANPKNTFTKGRSINSQFLMSLLPVPIIAAFGLYACLQARQFQPFSDIYFLQEILMIISVSGLTIYYGYSVLCKARDSQQYLIYPYRVEELGIARIVAAWFMSLPASLFILIHAIGTLNFFTNPAIAIIYTVFIVLISQLFFFIMMAIIIIFGKKQNSNFVEGLITVIGLILFIAPFVIVSMTSTASATEISANSHMQNIAPFLERKILLLVVALVLTIVLTIILARFVVQNVSKTIVDHQTSKRKQRKNFVPTFNVRTKSRSIDSYNIKLILSNVQVITMNVIFAIFGPVIILPVIMLILNRNSQSLSMIEATNIWFAAGVGIYIMSDLFPIGSFIYSFEGTSLNYLYSLPLTKQEIFFSKFKVATILTLIPRVIIAIVFAITFKIGFMAGLMLTIGMVIMMAVYQMYNLIKDYQSPQLIWSTEMDLLQGGGRTFMRIIFYYLRMIAIMILLVIQVFLLGLSLMFLIINAIVFALIVYLLMRKLNKEMLI